MDVIATELLKGMGLGNQLFCYVAIRSLAKYYNIDYSILNFDLLPQDVFANLSKGIEISKDSCVEYHEKDERLFLGNSFHDINIGCYISGTDSNLLSLNNNTLVYGNLQAEDYFRSYKNDIKKWLEIIPEKDCYDYSKDNLCIINIRGGEYAGDPSLFLRRKYWLDAMKVMRNIRDDMEFMVITDDTKAAHRILPEVKAYHFDLAGDYSIIKNAHYLILSNSTFAFFPAYTNEVAKKIIAPKYWARHNVSNGYWASEQNIYDEFEYMDRHGKLFTSSECRKELDNYKKNSKEYKRLDIKISGLSMKVAKLHASLLIKFDLLIRAFRSLGRRIRKI